METCRYAGVVEELLARERLAALGPGRPNKEARHLLQELTVERAFAPRLVKDRAAAEACLAALWLYHDFLDESHRISQEIETVDGSYWHALMHRREPDAANGAYWFRRVGVHPIFPELAKEAQGLGLQLGGSPWSPFDFIDLCEQHRGTSTAEEMTMRRVQQREWQLLFDWCFRQASGAA